MATKCSAASRAQPPRGGAAVFAVVITIATSIGYFASFGNLTFSPKTFAFDLVSFHCGGVAVAAHADPYRVEPLRACEHRIVAPAHANSPLVIPAPQPAYVLGAMAALAALPYTALEALVVALQLAAYFATVRLLASSLAISPWILWAALGLSDLYASLYLGQLGVFCTLGIVLAGVGLQRRSVGMVGAGLTFASCEPHVALPLFAGVAMFGSRCEKLATVATGAALLVISLFVLPLGVLHEYAANVLTMHAISETSNQDQLSLSYALRALGVDAGTAVAIAKVQYIAAILAALAVLPPLAKRYGRAAIAFAPPAFALFGGPFVHVTQMSAAIPAICMLFAQNASRWYALALFSLAIPWIDARALLTVLPLVTAGSAALARYALGLRPFTTWALALACTIAIGYAGFSAANERVPETRSYGTISATDLAEIPWRRVVELRAHTHVTMANLEKLPTEFGLVSTLAGMLLPAFARRRELAPISSGEPVKKS